MRDDEGRVGRGGGGGGKAEEEEGDEREGPRHGWARARGLGFEGSQLGARRPEAAAGGGEGWEAVRGREREGEAEEARRLRKGEGKVEWGNKKRRTARVDIDRELWNSRSTAYSASR